MNECQLDKEPFFQCCCVCKHHIEDFYQCTIQPGLRASIEKETGKATCICGIHKGWVCIAPIFHHAHSDWPEHSCGCEMFYKVKR